MTNNSLSSSMCFELYCNLQFFFLIFPFALHQLNILSKDTRSLYLPTRIRRLCIDSQKHFSVISKANQNGSVVTQLTASYDPSIKLIECGGVQIYDMNVNAIARRKPTGIEGNNNYSRIKSQLFYYHLFLICKHF